MNTAECKPQAGGWVRLYRKILDSAIFQDPELFKLWCLCLLLANHKDLWAKADGITQPVQVKRGQFITGRFALHKAYYPRKKKKQKSPLTLWRWMQILENMENLNIKTNNKFSIITIVNYEKYQSDGTDNEQQNEQQMNNSRTTDEQQVNTNKNVKNVNNDKNEKKELVPAAAGEMPAGLLELIDGWNALGNQIVKPGNGARRDPPAKAVLAGWKQAMKEHEQRDHFQDIPAVLEKIKAAKYCHQQSWFTLPWLFGRNQKQEYNIERLMADAHTGANRNGSGKRDTTPGPGQRHSDDAKLDGF
jgi:hypothetical protein